MLLVDFLEGEAPLVAHVDNVGKALTRRLDADARRFRDVAVENGAEFGVGGNDVIGGIL